jgi:O-acetyl-ADP-ribose deacetylase (regulator of RNase III)
MLEFVNGDFFEFDADVRVNTVNCVGVMGAGVALAFKKKYSEMYKEYVKKCKAGQIKPGKPYVWKSVDMFSKSIEIINFPTKNHWRTPSEYAYVDSGLHWLSGYLKERDELTITLPALGCGHGGLDWEKVKALIQMHLGESHHRILVFEPFSSINAGKEKLISIEEKNLLVKSGINILKEDSVHYPDGLRRYTEKNLYFHGDLQVENKFDISIISSSKPSENEKQAIYSIVNYCKKNCLSILFGSTAFDKKTALGASEQGVKAGVFLPSGILKSANSLANKHKLGKLQLLSIGDPFESFNRKAYMPSVISRIFIGKATVFTTDRLDWLEKHEKLLNKNHIRTFFINYKYLSNKDRNSVKVIHSDMIDVINGEVNIQTLNL